MGFRARKSIKIGPFRINLSKSGIGYSYGVKGYRVTHKANGGVRTTVSIPGTGISHVTETAKPNTHNSAPAAKPTKVCSVCGHPVAKGNKRCPDCGQKIIRRTKPVDVKSILCGLLLAGILILAVVLSSK